MIHKVDEAVKATVAVKEYVQQAQTVLASKDAAINAVGVLLRPRYYREALLAAVSQLQAAAEVIETTSWPTKRDYDNQ